ncbi:hypothetical protein [Rubripirellula tenax]|uniref:hypothetical protein n=1 Tax=Rubripirellula tenax TaxID=2528015 RepID=UPI0011B6EBD8|nr:hypothetical protein [Rubripirellula tenax]
MPDTPVSSTPSSNPYSEPIGGSIGGATRSSQPQTSSYVPNPYQPSVATPGSTQIGELQVGQRSVEEIFGAAFAIFKERWGTLVGGYAIVFAISIAAAFGPNIVGLVAGMGGNKEVAAALSGLSSIFFNLLSSYFTLGFCGVALAVARNENSPLSKLLPPINVFGRFLGGLFLLILACGGVVALVGGIVALIVTAGGGEGVAIGMIVLAVVVLLPMMFVMYWLLWSWAYVLVDQKGDTIGALKASFGITLQNKLTSVLLLVITMIASFAGLLACYIGLLVATPFWMLMLAVGYLMITGQPISDPRMIATQSFGPRPQSPTF